MKLFYFLCFCIFSFCSIIRAAGLAKFDCLEKEKALTLLETAENFLANASISYPSCKKNLNSTNQKECDSQKSLAYVEISKKLISDVRRNFPSCYIVNETTVDKYADCSRLLASGQSKSGIYTIYPKHFSMEQSLKVFCDMETDGGGWTVIQRRGKYPVQQDFNNDWETYRNGFGNLTQEFWLGNENIRLLCLYGCKIRFDLVDYKGVYRFAVYQNLTLSRSFYRTQISGYKGNATDAMKYLNNKEFSTKDKDMGCKDTVWKSGWWHGSTYSNLNGIYKPGSNGRDYVYWWKESNDYFNLQRVEMKVKPH